MGVYTELFNSKAPPEHLIFCFVFVGLRGPDDGFGAPGGPGCGGAKTLAKNPGHKSGQKSRQNFGHTDHVFKDPTVRTYIASSVDRVHKRAQQREAKPIRWLLALERPDRS